MRTKFEHQLQRLNAEMIQMGNAIEENIRDSVQALVSRDIDKAKQIMERDAVIDQMQRRIESICFNLLIQQQPVARDLRYITAAMKMVTDMERIGDHAADISEMVVLMADQEDGRKHETIAKMASEAIDMLIKSVDAFIQKDGAIAKWVIGHDDVVDDLFITVKEDLIERIRQDSERGEVEIDLLMVAKYLERIADHATNISEWVLYSLENNAVER